MAYTTINKSTDYFNTVTYSNAGDGAKAVTGVGFQPDWVWLKNRTVAMHHQTFDAVRGATNGALYTSLNNAVDTGYPISSFDSDGFTTGSQSGNEGQNSANQIAWNWKANGAGSSNTDGSTNSTVSVNTTAGFSIVKYAGADAVRTVGHGLGVKPNMIIVKRLGSSGSWQVYHSSLGATKYLLLDGSGSEDTSTARWNDTEPTSSVFTLGTSAHVNESGDYIAYCFGEKTGYSKFGSYTGGGTTFPFIYTGFKPTWLLIKKSNTSGNGWFLMDTKTNTYNPQSKFFQANTSNAETSVDRVDILSNGFKPRYDWNIINTSGDKYIYMAFGQSLVGSNNVPCTAR